MILNSYFCFIIVLLGIAVVPRTSSNTSRAYHVRDHTKLDTAHNIQSENIYS